MRHPKKTLALTALLFLLSASTACQQGAATRAGSPAPTGAGVINATDNGTVAAGYQSSASATNYVDIQMDSGAHIVVQLMPESAPLTVANFQKLVSRGFYDGIIFHRIIPRFVIQGGDPKGTGIGGSSDRIKGEFSQNGVNNTLHHDRGVISMARTANDLNSATSQFFICLAKNSNVTGLDGGYAAFGKVVSGMEEVDRIAALPTSNDRPLQPPKMQRVFFVSPRNDKSN